MVLSIITWWLAMYVMYPTVGTSSLEWISQDHGDFFVQRTGLIEAWQAMLVPHCEYWNFISPLSTDLPTLKRPINTFPLKGLAQSQ